MLKSLYSGVSGLQTHQKKMDVIGNNIANVNTTGYKSTVVTFCGYLLSDTEKRVRRNLDARRHQPQTGRLRR